MIRDLPLASSNLRKTQSCRLPARQNVVAIADIDTRKLTRILREKGAQNGCLVAGKDRRPTRSGQSRARIPRLAGMDLAKVVSCAKPTSGPKPNGRWARATAGQDAPKSNVVAYDFGIKRNILRKLAARGCKLTVIPAQSAAKDALALKPDGVFLSNGPGDPEPCDYAIRAIRELLAAGIPIFGICLGHQLLGLASGARTVKMKFGHHGANHPVQDLDTGRVMITSQNHGFRGR